jgi:hypothetical protein
VRIILRMHPRVCGTKQDLIVRERNPWKVCYAFSNCLLDGLSDY